MLLSTSASESSITAARTSMNIVTSGNATIGIPTPMMPLSIPARTRLPARAMTIHIGTVVTRSISMSDPHTVVAGLSLGEPDDAKSLRGPVDDVAGPQAPKSWLIIGDQVHGISVTPHRRLPHRRDDARAGVAVFAASERHEPDHRHDVLRRIRFGHRIAAERVASRSRSISVPRTRAESPSSCDRITARR